MVEKTLTVGDTEVVIRESGDKLVVASESTEQRTVDETDSGFEVEEVSDDDPYDPDTFKSKTGYGVGSKIGAGTIDDINNSGTNIKVKASDRTYDLFESQFFESCQENGYLVCLVEFEKGYIRFRYDESLDQNE